MKKAIVLISLSLIFSGCKSTTTRDNPLDPHPMSNEVIKIEDISKNLKNNSGQISILSKGITEKADIIRKDNPKLDKINEIKTEAEKIDFFNIDNLKNADSLIPVTEQIIAASKQVDKMTKEISRLKSDATTQSRKLWMVVISLAALCLVASIFLTISYSPKIGLPLMFSSIATIAVATFLATYIHLVAIVGGVICFGILGFFLHQAYLERKALKESVVSMEVGKEGWDEESKEKVKGIQSLSTKNIVLGIKDELKKNGIYSALKKQ